MITMGTLRRLLQETTSVTLTQVDRLRPGDVFLLGDKSLTVVKPGIVKKQNGYLFVKGRSSDESPTNTHVMSPEDVRYAAEEVVDTGDIKDWLREFYSTIDWALPGTYVSIVSMHVIEADELYPDKLTLHYAEGARADEINDALAQDWARHRSRRTAQGVTHVQVIGTDPRHRVGERTAPKEATTADLIMDAIMDGGNEPMTAEEIMRIVKAKQGKPYVPGAGSAYFAPYGALSLVQKGFLGREGTGPSATFTMNIPDKPNWRPEEMTGEDYYAL